MALSKYATQGSKFGIRSNKLFYPWICYDRDEEGADPGFKEIPVPTPEMVHAQFPTVESILGDQDQQATSQLRWLFSHASVTSFSKHHLMKYLSNLCVTSLVISYKEVCSGSTDIVFLLFLVKWCSTQEETQRCPPLHQQQPPHPLSQGTVVSYGLLLLFGTYRTLHALRSYFIMLAW